MLDPLLTGRSVVVDRGQQPPEPWRSLEGVAVVAVTAVEAAVADELLRAWRERRPVVVELEAGLGFDDPSAPPAVAGPAGSQPWEWPVDLRLLDDEIHHGIWANSVDGRASTGASSSTPLPYRWGAEARALGARPAGLSSDGDVLLDDGTLALCDGGPLDAGLADRLSASGVGSVAVVHRVAIEHGQLTPFSPGSPPEFPLDAEQLAAVTALLAGARVIAPAGSGKTRVLTERARLLVEGWRLPPSSLALVAYNVRARDELQQRLAGVGGVRIRTLNALSLRLAGDRRTIEERDVRNRLRDFVPTRRVADADPLAPWLEALTRVRLGLRPPAEVEAEMPDVAGLEDVVRGYRSLLAERGEVDFDEQVVAAIRRLLGDPAFRAAAQRSARVLLVDEFQDLTPAHLLLLRLLSGPAGAVFGVGDDDQTIYGYAGASPEWLVRFERWFPGTASWALEINYRCAPPVVEAASNVLTRNAVRVPKTIRTRPGRAASDGRLDMRPPSPDPAGESAAAVQHLVGGSARVAPADVAVLCRVNALLAPVQVLLRHSGVPVRSLVDERFLGRSTVRAALAWCAIAVAAPKSSAWSQLEEAARRPKRGMSESLRRLLAKQKSGADLQSLAGWLEGKGSVREAVKVEELAADVERVRSVAAKGTEAVLRLLRDEIGLASSAAALDSWSYGSVSSHEDDLDALLALAHLQPDVEVFGSWLRRELSKPSDDDGVTLASIHAVKGREWPYVVLHHATDGILPHRLVEDVEEERRVFHVAITRSSIDTVVVPGAKPSPFLAEAGAPGAPPAMSGSSAGLRRNAVVPIPKGGGGSGGSKAAPADRLKTDDDKALFEKLREWRRTVSAGKPAYTVLTDATLVEVVLARPADERGLSLVSGIGPSKLEQYGDDVLAIVND